VLFQFQVEFMGEPDRNWFAYHLRRLLEEL
jgi:hypothetical protein